MRNAYCSDSSTTTPLLPDDNSYVMDSYDGSSASRTTPPLAREESLGSLYGPVLLWERMSSTFKPLEEEEEPIPDLSPPNQETTYGIGFRPSPTPEKVITRDFAHTFSVRRKPVPITPPSGILRNDTAASLTPSTAGRLEGAGQAAQDRRKKRRLSTAFSEMNFSEGKGDKDEMEVELLGKGEEDKPKRFKRIKSRLSGWFGGKKE